jgi:hypothetical protein
VPSQFRKILQSLSEQVRCEKAEKDNTYFLVIYIPEKYDFAFLVIDDTDCARLPEIKEIYDILYDNGMRTNKTVWVYPPRDEPKNFGSSLVEVDYARWIKKLQRQGFEIGLHNVGSGDFSREEIIEGLKIYEKVLGSRPAIHVNHSYNNDNIYSGERRFSPFFGRILKTLYPNYQGFEGCRPGSNCFWGDIHKELIKYSRNVELPGLNIGDYFDSVPFIYKNKKEYSNFWYPATFAPNPLIWEKVVTEKSIENLKRKRGAAIVYTHFGYYHLRDGRLDGAFRSSIERLGSENGWYVTLSDFLDYQMRFLDISKIELSGAKEIYLDLVTLYTRIKYRFFQKVDDYHFKRELGLEW